MRPEETIEKKFVAECLKIGIKSFKFEIQGIKGPPDQIVILPKGIIVFIEFKRPNGGVISKHQEKFILYLKDNNHIVHVYDNWESPLKLIKELLCR